MEKGRVSKPFVIRWTQSPDQDFNNDKRGWPSGKSRLYSDDTSGRIKEIYHKLKNDPRNYYMGATAVLQGWRRSYPKAPAPSLRTIGRIMKDLGLTHVKKGRNRGATAYLWYPEHTIYSGLGGRVLEADFIGKKYISGRTAPVNFIGYSFKKEPRLRYYKRIEGQTAECFIEQTDLFFPMFERPDYIRLDNALAMIGSASGKRNISSVMLFLLNHHVILVFAVPRKPFSQASIEGNNSVFARLFWNRSEFSSLKEIDKQLEWFNQSSLKYTNYIAPENNSNKSGKDFQPEVMFIRQVIKKNAAGYIDVLNEQLPKNRDYINYFVLARWSLKERVLRVFFERENRSILIDKFPFLISGNSLKKVHAKGKLSFDL